MLAESRVQHRGNTIVADVWVVDELLPVPIKLREAKLDALFKKTCRPVL